MNLCEIKPSILKITQFIQECFNVILESISREPVCSGSYGLSFHSLSINLSATLLLKAPAITGGCWSVNFSVSIFCPESTFTVLILLSLFLSVPILSCLPFCPLSCTSASAALLRATIWEAPEASAWDFRLHRGSESQPHCYGNVKNLLLNQTFFSSLFIINSYYIYFQTYFYKERMLLILLNPAQIQQQITEGLWYSLIFFSYFLKTNEFKTF